MKNSHFCLSILFVILLAKLTPYIGSTGGILRPEITVKYVAVFIIFLNSGLTLPTEDLASAFLQWDLHLFVQGFTFIVFPVIQSALTWLLQFTYLNQPLLDGMTVLSTMPPPVSSAIILTRAVDGNEAAAVFNSVFGSMLGILVTPSLLMYMLGSTNIQVPTSKIFSQLFVTVAIPLVIGQLIRHFQYCWLMRQNIPYKSIGQCLIMFIIYSTFCNTFSRTDFNMDTVADHHIYHFLPTDGHIGISSLLKLLVFVQL